MPRPPRAVSPILTFSGRAFRGNTAGPTAHPRCRTPPVRSDPARREGPDARVTRRRAMHFVVVLTYMNTDWNQAYTISLKFKGAKYGTWELHNPNVVPWGLVCHAPKGTFTLFPDQQQIEFYSHMDGDSAGVNTLSFVFYDAPKSK